MKKIIALLLTLTMLVGMTALLPSCGSMDAKSVYEKAETTMSSLESYTMNSTIDASVTVMGMTVQVPMTLQGSVDLKNKKVLCSTNITQSGVTTETKVYLDPEVYMLETMGMKYMGSVGGQLDKLMGSYINAAGISFDSFSETSMEKESGGYVLKIKGLKEGTDISALLGSVGGAVSEDDQKVIDSIKGFDTIEITLHVDKNFHYTSMEFSMSLTMDSSELTAQSAGDAAVTTLSAGEDDFDFDLGSGDFDFDLGSGDFNFDFGEMSITFTDTITFSDFNAAADKVVKPSTDGYVEMDLDDILALS